MASQYEINEVGFIGSIWQGQIAPPLPVGRTIEIHSNSSRTLLYTDISGVNIDALNAQLPDIDFKYEIGYLDDEAIRNLELFVNVTPEYARTLKVLMKFNKSDTEKRSLNSRLPLQTTWEFNTSNLSDVRYKYSEDPDAIRYVDFVFLVTKSDLDNVISFFTNTTYHYDALDLRGIVNAALMPHKSSSDLVDIMGGFPIQPPTYTGSLFTIPPADLDTYTEAASEIDFRNHAAAYTVSSIDQANQKLQEISLESSSIFTSVDTLSGVAKIDALIKSKLFAKLRNFVLQQLAAIAAGMDTSTPLDPIDSSNPLVSSLDGFMLDGEGNFIVETGSKNNIISNDSGSNFLGNSDDEFDALIDDIIEDLTLDDNDVYVYKKISRVSDYALPIHKNKTYGLFNCAGEHLTTFFTGSIDSKNQRYYIPVFNRQYGTAQSFHQFDITYAHISGSGSSYVEDGLDFTPSKGMFTKYMLECFGTSRGKFRFKNNKNGDYFYAIQLDRDALRDKLDAGNFELSLCPMTSSANQLLNTGNNCRPNPSSSIIYTLIDESGDTLQKITDNGGHQEYYYISSGSLRDGLYGESTDDAWGIVFPKMGLIILDGVVLDQSCSFNTVTASYFDGDNSRKLFASISGSATRNVVRTFSGSFFARSAESDIVETYFCRVEHSEFNLSTNYTYVRDSDGTLAYDYFAKEPNSYISTIGLYNRNKELLAVGKLRNPVLKNDGNAYVFQVRVKLN